MYSMVKMIVLAQLHRLGPLLQETEHLDPKGLLPLNSLLHAVCRRPVLFATDAGNGDDDLTEADYPPADPNSTPKASSSSGTGSGSTAGSGSGQEEESPAQLGGNNSGSGSEEEEEEDKASPADVLGNEASSEGDEHAEVQSSFCISHVAGFQVGDVGIGRIHCHGHVGTCQTRLFNLALLCKHGMH